MLATSVDELAAIGASATRWFQGLSAGNSWFPSRVNSLRSSKSSRQSRRWVARLRTRASTEAPRGRARNIMSLWLASPRSRPNAPTGGDGGKRPDDLPSDVYIYLNSNGEAATEVLWPGALT